MRPRCKTLGERPCREGGGSENEWLRMRTRMPPARAAAAATAPQPPWLLTQLLPLALLSCAECAAGVDPLPAELEGQLEWDLLTAPFFIEAALVLPAHRALLLADTGAAAPGRRGWLLEAGGGRQPAWRGCAAAWLAMQGGVPAAEPTPLPRPCPPPSLPLARCRRRLLPGRGRLLAPGRQDGGWCQAGAGLGPVRCPWGVAVQGCWAGQERCGRRDVGGHTRRQAQLRPPAASPLRCRLGPITKIVFDRYPERGRAWLAAVRARSWEMVVPAHASVRLHGRPLGRADFDGCFSFLL